MELYMVVFYYNRESEQKLTIDEMMGVKLSSAVYPQMMLNNAGKQFFTCMYRKTLGNIFQRLF